MGGINLQNSGGGDIGDIGDSGGSLACPTAEEEQPPALVGGTMAKRVWLRNGPSSPEPGVDTKPCVPC